MNQVLSQRESSKQVRRERIVDCARNLIRQEGFDALNIRALAEAADVTVPTIYNLMAREMVQQLVSAHETSTTRDPIEKAEEVIAEMRAIYTADEKLSREVMLALDKLDSPLVARSSFHQPGRVVAIEDCQRALDDGLLAGKISSRILARGLTNAFAQAQHSWLLGHISLQEMENQALIGCFITLAADAKPKLHARLVEKIQRLGEGSGFLGSE
jgi:AcrR family transcriptional regulator